jgi:glycogen operon protein
MNENYSWNCGIEGPTRTPAIAQLRERQSRNLMLTLLLSQGVPMLLAGDEFLRTQQGNNNAWCQDNDISWIDWSLAETHADFLRFTRMAIALRRRHPALRRRAFFRGKGQDQRADIVWHGIEPYQPDFSWTSRTLAFCLDGSQTGRDSDHDFYVAFNSWRQSLSFFIPPAPNGKPWRRIIDTSLASPQDIVELDQAPPVATARRYLVAPHSALVLLSEH